MRGIVADQFERARVLARHELDLGVLLDRVGQVGELAVERHRDRALGERGRDALGDVETGDAVGIFAARAVGEGQGDFSREAAGPRQRNCHVSLLWLTPTNERG